MLIGHDHTVGWFDAGHCRARARESGLLDHHDRVQREEARLPQAGVALRPSDRSRAGAREGGEGGVAMNQPILVTGGSGTLGRHLVAQLLATTAEGRA